MPLVVVSLLVAAFLISAVACALMLRLSHRLALYDRAGSQAHKRDSRSVPNTGGIAIFLAVTLPMAVSLITVNLLPGSLWRDVIPGGDVIAEHREGLRSVTGIGGGIIMALSLIHLLGLIDDRRALGPYVKLFYQAVVAFMLVMLCDVRVMHFLDDVHPLGFAASAFVSIAWIIVIVNAMNFLDNMDGLSAGVGATIATLYLGATLIGGQWFVAALSALLVGALMGFMIFNFPPARMYMGDGGSLVLGLLLAVVSIRTTYFDTTTLTPSADPVAVSPGVGPGRWYSVLMPLMVMAIPLYDFVSVTFLRMMKGKSPFVGDRNHFSHRLVRKGVSRRRAVVLIWMCTLATGLGGVMLGSLESWQAWLAAGQTLVILAVLAVLERGTPDERVA